MHWGLKLTMAVALLWAAFSAQARGAACVEDRAYGREPYCLLFGDLDGDGQQEPVQFHAGVFSFGDLGDGPVQIGQSGDYPLLGDWNGDGRDTLGLYRDGRWLLSNDSSFLVGMRPRFDIEFQFGNAFTRPVTGDWNGDGTHTAGIVDRRGSFTLTDAVGGVRQTLRIAPNANLRTPITGDFDRDGDDEIGGITAAGRFALYDDINIPEGNPGELTVSDTNPCLDLFDTTDIGFLWVQDAGLIGATLDIAAGELGLFDASPIGECDYVNGVIIEIIP